jgi:hypothetical protein
VRMRAKLIWLLIAFVCADLAFTGHQEMHKMNDFIMCIDLRLLSCVCRMACACAVCCCTGVRLHNAAWWLLRYTDLHALVIATEEHMSFLDTVLAA